MKKLRLLYQERLNNALKQFADDKKIDWKQTPEEIVIEIPPQSSMGDLGFPLFGFSKIFRLAPNQIGVELQKYLSVDPFHSQERWIMAGPYLNLFFDRERVLKEILEDIEVEKERYGRNESLASESIMIEFSGPNTNKPLHLGHLRNDILGESLSNILKFSGANVRKVNIINDRGVHICKSMLAYQKFGEGETPESTGVKSDHFVGKYYVRFNEWVKENPSAEDEAKEVLRKWEAGDQEVMRLWEQMSEWALSGIKETYRLTNVEFDTYYFESETYKLGKEIIEEGLNRGVFKKNEEGAVFLDLSEINLDTKVMLRADGSSLYITQDLGTAVARQNDFPFNRLIYVVACEQDYHFKVLFYALQKMGYSWAENLHHLSYGMVNLPDGKMKSREGTIVDADDLLISLKEMAGEGIRERGREPDDETAHAIALGALHYYLLQMLPHKDMTFDPKESLSFNGNTGPYLQYTGARIRSIERKFNTEWATEIPSIKEIDLSLLKGEDEWQIVKELASFSLAIEEAALEYSPHVLLNQIYHLTKRFNRYYHENPIYQPEMPELSLARFALAKGVEQVLKNGLELLGIPFLEKM